VKTDWRDQIGMRWKLPADVTSNNRECMIRWSKLFIAIQISSIYSSHVCCSR
jgi:hypothetical protein